MQFNLPKQKTIQDWLSELRKKKVKLITPKRNKKLETIEKGRSRMDGWQLESFDKAYKQKIETGLSPIKEQKLQDEE